MLRDATNGWTLGGHLTIERGHKPSDTIGPTLGGRPARSCPKEGTIVPEPTWWFRRIITG